MSGMVIAGSPRSKLAKVFKAPDASLSTRSAAASAPRGTYMQSMGTKKSLHPMTIQQKIKLAEQRESQARMAHNMKRDRLKDIMGALAGPTGELQTADLLLAQKLAKIDLPEEFLLKTPYAQQYSEAGSDGASPRAIKVQPFYNAIDYEKMQHTEEFLEQHALREQKRAQRKAAADALAAEEAAKAAAAAKAAEDARLGTSLRAGKPQVGDDELRRAHAAIKARLSSQFGELRLAFRAFDQDGSGRVTHREAEATLNTLNLGLPRRITQALVDIADFDCDGDISFAEFARVLTADDIIFMKDSLEAGEGGAKVNSRMKGPSVAKMPKVIKDGVTDEDIRLLVTSLKEKTKEKYMRYDKAFKTIDEDRSGYLSREEFRFFIYMMNLQNAFRKETVEVLIDIMDADGDGKINHQEFVRMLEAEDPMNMGPLASRAPVVRKPYQ